MRGEVLIDLRPLQGPSAGRGIGTYVRGLVGGLSALRADYSFGALLDAGLPRPELPPGWEAHPVRRRYRGRLAGYEDAAVLGSDLDRLRPALFHATTLALPSRAPCPVVVTLHDLIPWAWGGPWMAGERVRYFPGKRLLRRAEAVIAVSDTTAADATAHAGVPRERIQVVPEGVGADFRPTAGAAERVAERWQQRRPFFFYVGALDRRKDPVGMVRAWRAAQRAGVDADLVIAGDPGAQAPGRMGGARLLGRVSDAELADLLNAAICLLFPSRYEGFGLPVVEAMACGCPVVAYDTPAVAEVAGDAARLVRVGDAVALGRAAVEVATDPAARSALVEAGRQRAARYTWANAARQTVRVYDQVCGNLSRR